MRLRSRATSPYYDTPTTVRPEDYSHRRITVSDTALERPTRACLLHSRPADGDEWKLADDGYTTCSSCLDRVRRTLGEIRDRWAKLDPSASGSVDMEGRAAPGFGSRSPASDHVVAMRDRRSKSCEVALDGVVYETWVRDVEDGWIPEQLDRGFIGPAPVGVFTTKREAWFGGDGRPHSEQERPPLSVHATVSGLCFLVAEDREMGQPKGALDDLVRWLDGQLDYVTRQDWVRDVEGPLRELNSQMKPVTGEGRRTIGHCPTLVGEDGDMHECGAKLYAPTELSWSDTIRCHSCTREWSRAEWLRLADMLEAS